MSQRAIEIIPHYLIHPEGSALVSTGKTKVLCTATVENSTPGFLREINPPQGWITAEYGMLPRSTQQRMRREANVGKVSGRTAEIQRLIGRSLRNAVDLTLMPGYSITLDCDVLQADGGTRTASVTGACVALYLALSKMVREEILAENPFKSFIAAVSVGIIGENFSLDLCYEEDAAAVVDMNVVMNEWGQLIEVQGTAEHGTFSQVQLNEMLLLAKSGIDNLIKAQKEACGLFWE